MRLCYRDHHSSGTPTPSGYVTRIRHTETPRSAAKRPRSAREAPAKCREVLTNPRNRLARCRGQSAGWPPRAGSCTLWPAQPTRATDSPSPAHARPSSTL